MKVRFDNEDDLFLIPTIVVGEVSIARCIYFAWLHHSIVFIIGKSC